MARCFIGLGANQGNSRETFQRVLRRLHSWSEASVSAVSSTYISQAMGPQAGEDFLNAVVELRTTLEPSEILAKLQRIETALGRVRGSIWGPRTIDLDLIYFADECLSGEVLTLPHPHAWYRRFVLLPMCEIDADFVHPRFLVTQSQLLQRIDRKPFKLLWLDSKPLPKDIEPVIQDFPQLEISFDSTPDESVSLIVGMEPEFDARVPVLNLGTLPAKRTEDALRSALVACLGSCVPAE